MKHITIKHPNGVSHQLDVSISYEGKAQVSLDGADDVQPTIGMSIDWGDGVKTPNVVLCFDWNGKKRTGDIRVELFEGWLTDEGRNYAVLNGVVPEAPPEPVFAKLGEMGCHEDHAPTGLDPARADNHGSGNC